MKAEQIEQVVNEILISLKSGIFNESNFLDFKNYHQTLYEMVISEEFDITIFKKMMYMKKQLENGESKDSLDIKVGKFMAEKYVDPLVEKLNKEKKINV